MSFLTDSDNNERFETTHELWVWDVDTGRRITTYAVRHPDDISSVHEYPAKLTFSLDGKKLFSPEMRHQKRNRHDHEGSPTGELQLRDVLSGQIITFNTSELYDDDTSSGWTCLTFPADKHIVAAIYKSRGSSNGYSYNDRDGTICAWDMRTKKLLWKNYDRNIHYDALQFSPNGRRLACGGHDYNAIDNMFSTKGKLSIIDVSTGQILSVLTEETSADRFEQVKQTQAAKWQARLAPKPARRGPRFAPGDSGSIEALVWSPDSKKLGELCQW